MKKSTKPQTIAFVGDTHCGSHWGLHPTGDEWLPRSSKWTGIRYLMECFGHMVDSWPEIDLLVLTGDLIDGPQRKSSGTGVFSTKMGDQVDLAIEVLRPLAAKAKKIIRVDGTPYHEDFHNALSTLDHALGVSKTSQIFDIDLEPGILNIAHHPMGGSMLYRGTQVDREGLWAAIAAVRRKVPMVRWIFRAHVHDYMMMESQDTVVVSLPCWELATPHAKKTAYWRFQPSLGGVLMEADKTHPSGYRITPHLYDPPQPTVTKMGEIRAQAKPTA